MKNENELGMEVPSKVAKKANDIGCIQGVKYVYKEGTYGDKAPASSIGGKKATRFGSIEKANANKVSLGYGWVAFASPSYSGVNTNSKAPISEVKSKPVPRAKSSDAARKDTNKARTVRKAVIDTTIIDVKREYEFFQGFIRLKLSVSNNSSLVLTDVELDFHYDEKNLHLGMYEPEYDKRTERIHLGNIHANMSKSIAVCFEPMICSKGTVIDCIVTYKDATGQLQNVKMQPMKIEVTCPILKSDSDINVARLYELIGTLPCKDSRIYGIRSAFDVRELKNDLSDAMHKYDIQHLRTIRTSDMDQFEMWFYSRTKVRTDDIVLRLSICSKERTVELFAATDDARSLTGLLADMGREIQKAIEKNIKGKEQVYQVFNLSIKDSVVQRSNLLSHCDLNDECRSDIVIEDSIIQRSTPSLSDRQMDG